MNVAEEFISKEPKQYKFKLGWFTASGLSGFIAGVVAASIIWYAAAYVLHVLSSH